MMTLERPEETVAPPVVPDMRLHSRRVDRLIWAFMGVALLGLIALAINTFVIWSQPDDFAPISYSPQVVERVDALGVVSVPKLVGFDGPAVCLSDTVPVRGIRQNSSDRDVSTTGRIITWSQDPPGKRFVFALPAAALTPPGATQLTFNNEIPEEVAEFVRANGPTQFSLSGVTEVLAPHGVPAAWQTPSFYLVDC